MTLWPSDGIKLSDNTKDWEHLALAKIKNMVASAEIYVPDPIIEVPEEPSASSATESPVSSATEAPVASSAVEAPVSSEATVASSVSTQETTTPSESTTEA